MQTLALTFDFKSLFNTTINHLG